MNTRRRSTLLAAGLRSASLLAFPLAFATQGTKKEGAVVAGQQTKPHTGGKQHRATGQRAKRESAKLESTGAL